jgi:lysophospholipase L1-like esterase
LVTSGQIFSFKVKVRATAFSFLSLLVAFGVLVLFFMKSATSKTKLVVCFGDSLTAGYYQHGLRFEPYCRSIKVDGVKSIDYGTPGMTSSEMTSWVEKVLQEVALTHDSSAFEFWAFCALGGTNDLSVAKPDTIAANMKLVGEKAQAKFKHVLLGTLPVFPNLLRFSELHKKLKDVNQLLKSLPFSIIPFENACDVQDESLWDDGLHNSPKGYQVMGKLAEQELRKLLK